MTDVRPEVIDRYSLHHRHGCKASRVTVRPSFVRAGWTYLACRDCGAVGSVQTDVRNPVANPVANDGTAP